MARSVLDYGPAERQRGAGNLRYSSRHGADLLAQYAYMGLGFKLVVVCDDSTQDYPTKTDLGGRSHLLLSTE